MIYVFFFHSRRESILQRKKLGIFLVSEHTRRLARTFLSSVLRLGALYEEKFFDIFKAPFSIVVEGGSSEFFKVSRLLQGEESPRAHTMTLAPRFAHHLYKKRNSGICQFPFGEMSSHRANFSRKCPGCHF